MPGEEAKMDGRWLGVTRRVVGAAVAFAGLALPAVADAASADARSRFVGSWKPVSAQVVDAEGAVASRPFGARPAGKLTCTAGGHMSALIARSDAPRSDPSAALWHIGRYSIDQRRRLIILHVQYSTLAAFEGTDVVRRYRFRGRSTLVLSSAVADGRLEITWRRIPGRP
jgi:hypothetical protein